MATYYVPSESGWAATGSYGNLTAVRVKAEQSYDAVLNKSTLTVSLQAKGTTNVYAGTYSLIDAGTMGGTFKANGSTIATFSHSASSSAMYKVPIDATDTWRTVTNDTLAYTWTVAVNHNPDGTASVPFILDARLYAYLSGGDRYGDFDDQSATLSLNNTPSPTSYTLTISEGTGSTITVKRGSTTLSNGASVTHGDTLTITFSALSGYTLQTHTVNGTTFASGGTYTVNGNVTVAATATATPQTPTGTVRIWTGSSWQEYQPYVYDNGWKKCEAYIYTQNGWVKH